MKLLGCRGTTGTEASFVDLFEGDTAKIDEMKAMSKMSPEELAKKQQEALEEAKRRWEALSPEEKARIEA